MWSGPSQYAISAQERRRDKTKNSPAYQIISLFHQHEGYQQGKSNIRTDHAHQAILWACIRYGVRFDLDDFAVISGAGEREYAMACGEERGILNPSAAHAFEKHVGRKPFLIEDEGTVTPTRVYVGRRFKWLGKDVTCTSFAKDQLSFTACSYKLGDVGYTSVVEKRFSITHEAIKEFRERNALESRLSKFCEDNGEVAGEVRESLGNPKNNYEFHAIPMKAIRAVAKKYLGDTKVEA